MKTCSKCKVPKSESEFYRIGKSGKLRASCKSCVCAQNQKNSKGRYKKNPEKAKARIERWKKRHPEKFREVMRKAVAKQRRKKREAGTPELPLNVATAAERRCDATASGKNDNAKNLPAPANATPPPARRNPRGETSQPPKD